jgi:capsular polysaccharide export protein
VYIATSQAGLEALIQGVPVTCFGLPFYAGWGLTDDRLAIPRRQARPTLEQLVAAAYVRYCRYVDPLTDQRCDVMTVARQLARQKQQDAQFSGSLTVLGVPRHQQPAIRSLLNSRWGRVQFTSDNTQLMTKVVREDGKLLVWVGGEAADLHQRAEAHGVPIWRISPDAMPSPGRRAPASLVIDRRPHHSMAGRRKMVPDADVQRLVQVRGMPCCPEHVAGPETGLLDSCARYRQVRRYINGMLGL